MHIETRIGYMEAPRVMVGEFALVPEGMDLSFKPASGRKRVGIFSSILVGVGRSGSERKRGQAG
jgi:hypothetical protein